MYEHAVRFTEKKIQFTEGNRNNFVFALANNLNPKGLSESMALSYILADYGYDNKEVTTAVQSAYSNTAEPNTDKFIPKEKSAKSARSASNKKNSGESSVTKSEDGNFSDDGEQPSYIDKLENFLNNRYNFRYNTVLGKLE